MTNHVYEMNCGFFVCLTALNSRLEDMSHGAHQWMSVTVPEVFLSPEGEARCYVIVGYSNPQSRLPNHLCFILPLVTLGGCPEASPELLVRFSPWSTKPLSKGLYLDDGRLSYDPLEDFDRFWTPLKECLCSRRAEGYIESLEADPGFDGSTLDGLSYREALSAHMVWLSQSKETIQNALDD
jgi:hypothetical protein